MKIGIVIWRIAFSGAENVANALVEQFIQMGHEVQIILTASKAPEDTKCRIYSVMAEGNKLQRVLNRSKQLREINAIEKYDIIIGFGHIDTIHCIRAFAGSKTKIVGCARMDPILYPQRKSLRIERFILYHALSGMIVQTNAQKEYFEKCVKRNCFVIPNPVRESLMDDLKYQPKKKKISTVARLDNAQKNHIFMFQCFEEFLKTYPEYELDIYGNGPDEALYREYIAAHNLGDKVFLKGYTDNAMQAIQDSEMFLLTSNHEGMPNALIEAMSIGIPAISIDCGGGGPKDLIVDGENGFLVPTNDRAMFVERMILLASNDELRAKIANESKKIRVRLNVREIAQKWISAFDTIIRGNNI